MAYGISIVNADGKVVIDQNAFCLNLSETKTASYLLNSENCTISSYGVPDMFSEISGASWATKTSDPTAYRISSYTKITAFGNVDTSYLYYYPFFSVNNPTFPNGNFSPEALSTATAGRSSPLANIGLLNTSQINFFFVPVGGWLTVGFPNSPVRYDNPTQQHWGISASWKTGIKIKSTMLPVSSGGYGVEVYDMNGDVTYASTAALGLLRSIGSLQIPSPASYPGVGAWYASADVDTHGSGWFSHDLVSGDYRNYAPNSYRKILNMREITLHRVNSTTMRVYASGYAQEVASQYAAATIRAFQNIRYFVASAPNPM